jgi:hypothetical protein
MKKWTALGCCVVILIALCDIPTLSGPNPGKKDAYGVYLDSLLSLQEDIARTYCDFQREKNSHAVYTHLLQSLEDTAILIGMAEQASMAVQEGYQFSLKGHLKTIAVLGLTEVQRERLLSIGYSERDIEEIIANLLEYNDFCYHAMNGFTPEQRTRFYEMGLTDEQIEDLRQSITESYSQMLTNQQVIKNHQRGLLQVQSALSLAAFKILQEMEWKEKNKLDNLLNAEEKLYEAVLSLSGDQSSLERVKAFSRQVYKLAEQKICTGEDHYFLDYFVGLQIHCGALTALNGDAEFGMTEIRFYGELLRDLIESPERSFTHDKTESTFSDQSIPMLIPPGGIEGAGNVEESDEENNFGWIVVFIKTSDSNMWGFVTSIGDWLSKHVLPQVIGKAIREILMEIGVSESTSALFGTAGGAVFGLIMTAERAGGGWLDYVSNDPSGIFDYIVIDEETRNTIEEERKIVGCIGEGIREFANDPIQVQYTVWNALFVYRTQWGHYYYYMETLSNEIWAIEVEEKGFKLGRVIRGYKQKCLEFECYGNKYYNIKENWEYCLFCTLVWSRNWNSQSIYLL